MDSNRFAEMFVKLLSVMKVGCRVHGELFLR